VYWFFALSDIDCGVFVRCETRPPLYIGLIGGGDVVLVSVKFWIV